MYSVREPALQDTAFLLEMDNYPIREQLCKVVVLNFDESPLREITGSIVSGSLTIDGSSACRRTVSLSMVTDDPNVNELDWQIHTKYVLYIGLKNFVNKKYDDIIWFPQGMFIATSISSTSNLQGLTISLQGKDKMCLLDGSVGGSVFADHDFGRLEITNADGTITYEDLPIWRIIREAIHTYAHEPYENIMINDLEDIAVELLDYKMKGQGAFIYEISRTPDFTVYDNDFALDTDEMGIRFLDTWGYQDQDEGTTVYSLAQGGETYYFRVQKHLTYGDTAGYRRTELTYPGEFVIQAGGSITSMLDKITKLLGEFEYFYDIYGRFIFQRKKIYHNVVWNGVAPSDASNGYFSSSEAAQVMYDLANGQNVESFSNKPNLLNVRNDWVIWGEIGGGDKQQYPCHLRYAIDDKPIIYHCLSDGLWYLTDDKYSYEDGKWYEQLQNSKVEISPSDERVALAARDQDVVISDFERAQLPYVSVASNSLPTPVGSKFWGPKWNPTKKTTGCVDWRELLYRMAIDYGQAQARVETLSSARDNTTILQIVDIERLIKLYKDTDEPGTPATSGETQLGKVLCGNFTTKNIYNTDIASYWPQHNAAQALNEMKRYYGFWIWDNTIKRFRHIRMEDLEDVNKKRMENKQTLLTWSQWLRMCNKEIYFSLQSDSDYFQPLNEREGGAGVRQIYSVVPVRGLGYLNDSDNKVGFVNRIYAFMREIQMWEERLMSRYEIYFADLLAFWPIMYRTINDLSETMDLSEDDLANVHSRANANMRLSLIDIVGPITNFEASYKSTYNRTDISTDERILKFRAAANTLWQSLITQLTHLVGSNEVLTTQIGGEVISAIVLNNSDSGAVATIPTGYNPIDVYESTTLQNWYNALRKCILDILEAIKPNNANPNLYITPDTVKTYYDNYKNGYGTWIGVGATALQFDLDQEGDSRSLLDDVYKRWEENGYWDPDIIYYCINPSDTTNYNLLKFLAPENMLFWFDFLDANADLGKYKIAVIGHRPKVINDNNVKAIFFRDTPNVLFQEPDERQPEDHNLSYVYLQLSDGLAQYFHISTQGKSAKDELDTLLYETTYYQDTITINCLPIYYLEPNNRIRAVDNNTGICGEYVIKSLSISLSYDGMMSVQANKAADRIL